MTHSDRTIQLELRDGLATLTLDRPDALNALTIDMLDELIDALDRLEAMGARALLLTGAGRAFCAGMDLGPDVRPGESDAGAVIETHFNPLILKLFSLPIPAIAAVNGAAAGAGCALALACDLILANPSAYFLMAFVNIGLVPDSGATWLLPRLIGRARAAEMLLLGDRLPAEMALDWGLINRLVAEEELAAEAETLGRRLAAGPTRAYGLIRAGLVQAEASTLAETLLNEREHQRQAGETRDFVEGVAAFREKRKAQFEGR